MQFSHQSVIYPCFLATVVVPKTDINEISEQQELDQYQEGMKWFEDAKANFEIWWGRMQSGSLSDDQKRVSICRSECWLPLFLASV